MELPNGTRKIALSALCLLLGVALGCQQSQSGNSAVDAGHPAAASAAFSGVRHDLSQDEAAGGHTLKKHVGRTDDQLRERLAHERNISAASTYTDRDTAEHVVGIALRDQQAKIQRWLSRQGGHPNLVLDYDGSQPIGRTLRRGEDQTEPCSHALIVLKWNDPSDYYVLTTYPGCR